MQIIEPDFKTSQERVIRILKIYWSWLHHIFNDKVRTVMIEFHRECA
nr:unnamed protein product [Callosobruchus analis]